MTPTLFCIAKTQDQAQQILNRLRSEGFSVMDTSIVMTKGEELARIEQEQTAGKRTGAAAALGAATGGALGILIGLATFVIPGLEPFLAAGPIVAALADAAAAGTVGAIAGALVGMRVSDDKAKFFEEAVKQGSVLISAHTTDSAKAAIAKRIFEEHGDEYYSRTYV